MWIRPLITDGGNKTAGVHYFNSFHIEIGIPGSFKLVICSANVAVLQYKVNQECLENGILDKIPLHSNSKTLL